MSSVSTSTNSIVSTLSNNSVPAIVLTSDTNCPVTMANNNNNNNNLNGKLTKMYNLNVNVNVSAASSVISNFLAVESNCTTPRTPEILNSLMAMSNPLDDYNNYNASEKCAIGGLKGGSGNDSASNSSGSPLGSPANGSTPSVQKTCSDLIKAGLKLSIESKRKMSGSDSMDGLPYTKKLKKEEPYMSEDDYDDSYSRHNENGLTPEDEERRRRRRERNKIAATKCRLKKRERTVNLVNEAEVLEAQNIDLKAQIQTLQGESQHLANMITHHKQSCVKRGINNSSPSAQYNTSQSPYQSPSSYPISSGTTYEPGSPYIRPESANILATSYCDLENPPPSNYTQPVDSLELSSTNYSIPITEEHYLRSGNQNSYINGDDNYVKNSHILNMDSPDNDFIGYENQEVNHHQYNEHPSQQCHNMNNGCMA